VRWHRADFRCYWRWKSRSRGRRPQIEADLGALIRRMSMENPLWGAPRIHGELLKLGVRDRAVGRCQVHGPATRSTKSGMAHLSAQPRARHRRHRHVRRADPRQAPLWHRDHAARPTTPGMDQRHHEPDCRMYRPTDHRSIPLGSGTSPAPSGSRQVLPCNCPSPIASHGDS
jgi:hypothetical protein